MTAAAERSDVVTGWESIPAVGFDLVVYEARPASTGPLPVLIVIPENLGIGDWRQAETQRMAADLGVAVLVMSTYSRIGAKPPQGPFDTPDDRRRAAFLAMPDDQVADDLDVLCRWVVEQDRFSGMPALLGFCSGGGQALYATCTRKGLASCVVLIYGNVILRGEFTPDRQPLDRLPLVGELDCPLQGHFGELDHEVPPDHVDRLEALLADHHKSYAIYRYPGAGHVFSDETHPNFNKSATEEMWQRIYPFVQAHLGR